jgi:hypothetical protein
LIEVNANSSNLFAEINSSGNINYFGIPDLIELSKYGTGVLVDKN